jgi:hypothetical protein
MHDVYAYVLHIEDGANVILFFGKEAKDFPQLIN